MVNRANWACKSNSNSVQYVTLQKIQSFTLFSTPPIKLKLAPQIGGRLQTAITWTNHYDWPIINTEQQSDHISSYFLLSSEAGVKSLLCLLPASANCIKMLHKTILVSQTSTIDYCPSNFNLEGQLLSSSGVAPRIQCPRIYRSKW
jgi:hypothetical protein